MKRPFGETSTMPIRLESTSFVFGSSSEDSEDLVLNVFDGEVFDVSRKRFKMLLLLLFDVDAAVLPLFELPYSGEGAPLLAL